MIFYVHSIVKGKICKAAGQAAFARGSPTKTRNWSFKRTISPQSCHGNGMVTAVAEHAGMWEAAKGMNRRMNDAQLTN